MLKKFAFAISLLLISSSSYSRGLDVKLANNMAEFNYLTESSTFGYGGADIGFGALFTENNNYQISANLMVSGNPAGNNKALQFGVGGKLLGISFDAPDANAGVVALAAQARYIFPSKTPIALRLGLAYAPSITSFSGAESYSEYSFAIEAEVTPSARAYIGYRSIEYDFESFNNSFELDKGAHFGVKFEF